MEEEIIECCPNCGCAVAGELPEKDQWKELGKGLLSGFIGGYIGNKYGNEDNADEIAQNLAGGTYALLSTGQKRQVFEFCCPNCGYSWRSHGFGAPPQLSQSTINTNYIEQNSQDWENQAFIEEWNQFFESENSILSSTNALNNYLEKIESIIRNNVRETVVVSEYRYLQAFACSEYLYYCDAGNTSYSKYGEEAVDLAIQNFYDDEYRVLKLILHSYNLDFGSSDILSVQKYFDQNCPNIQGLQNTLVKTEYLEQVYNFSRFMSLLKTAEELDGKGMYKQAIDILNLMLELDTPNAYITASSHLYYCYLFEEDYKSFWDAGKAFRYAKQGADYAIEFMKSNYNSEDLLSKEWMTLVRDTASMFQYGVGVEVNLSEAERYLMIGVGHGDEESKKLLKELYDPTVNQTGENETAKENEQTYLEELKACMEDGIISDRERRLMDKLRTKLGISEERAKELEKTLLGNNSDAEKEYLETYKECLSEDGEISPKERRLLDKLREKLGISEARAKAIESSLSTASLSNEEQEYLESYKEASVDGTVSEKERKLLEKLRIMYGISENRAKELENM